MPAPSTSAVVPYATETRPMRNMREVSDREMHICSGILREFGQFQAARTTLAGHCEEVAQLILPTSKNTFFFENYNTQGAKKTQQQVDATGAVALHRFCAIANSLVTPRNMYWHGLAGDDYVMKDRATRLWFETTTSRLFKQRYDANANFAAQNYNNWQSLGAFGNATMFIDRYDNRWHGGGRGLRYKSVPFGETYYGENHQGKVDRIIRWFRLTAYQAVQKWGIEWLPGNLQTALDSNSQTTFSFLHCVKPRDEDYDPEALDERAFPFTSHYVSMEGRCLMAPEGGYRDFPYAVSRYDQAPGETYGRGPAMIVLPSLKTLNAQKVTFLKQGHRAADPVLLLSDDGIVGMDMRPGAMNKGGVTSDGKLLVHTLPTGDIKTTIEMMQEERTIIEDVFLTTIMKTLVENANMTATQVVALANERGMLVAPTLGRQHTEYVGGMVPRELNLMSEMDMLDPMPPRLREAMGAYEVTDTSPLSKAAQMGEVAGFNMWVDQLARTANQLEDPSWLDPVNSEAASRDVGRILGVRESWTSTDEQIAAKVKGRQNAAAQQARIAALPAEAAMVKAQAAVAKTAPMGVPQ